MKESTIPVVSDSGIYFLFLSEQKNIFKLLLDQNEIYFYILKNRVEDYYYNVFRQVINDVLISFC